MGGRPARRRHPTVSACPQTCVQAWPVGKYRHPRSSGRYHFGRSHAGHSYFGHNYMDHNYTGHDCTGNNSIGHNPMGHTDNGHAYMSHNYICHTHAGHNYIRADVARGHVLACMRAVDDLVFGARQAITI